MSLVESTRLIQTLGSWPSPVGLHQTPPDSHQKLAESSWSPPDCAGLHWTQPDSIRYWQSPVRVHQTPPDSTGVHWSLVDWLEMDSIGLGNWTGLHWTPLDCQSGGLGGLMSDLACHSVWWSLLESNRIMWGRDKDSLPP